MAGHIRSTDTTRRPDSCIQVANLFGFKQNKSLICGYGGGYFPDIPGTLDPRKTLVQTICDAGLDLPVFAT